QIVMVIVPVGIGIALQRHAVGQLANENRRTAFTEKKKSEAGADGKPAVENSRAYPGAVGFLVLNEVLAPFTIPVMAAKKALTGESTGALQAVEVIESPS